MKGHLLGCCLGVGGSQGIIQIPGLVTGELLHLQAWTNKAKELLTKPARKELVQKTHLCLCLTVWSQSKCEPHSLLVHWFFELLNISHNRNASFSLTGHAGKPADW